MTRSELLEAMVVGFLSVCFWFALISPDLHVGDAADAARATGPSDLSRFASSQGSVPIAGER